MKLSIPGKRFVTVMMVLAGGLGCGDGPLDTAPEPDEQEVTRPADTQDESPSVSQPEPELEPEPAPAPEPQPEPEPGPEPEPEPMPPTPIPMATGEGIWISADEIAALPASGAGWEAMVERADNLPSTADISDQDSGHDIDTMAAALVCAKTQEPTYCANATAALLAAIGTEEGSRWLAIGRNLLGYAIAADVMGLRSDGDPQSDGSRIEAWLVSFLSRKLAHNNSGEPIQLVPFGSGSNASAQEGAGYAAVAAYVGDAEALERVWDAYRTYACDPTAPDNEQIDVSKGVAFGWAHDDDAACAVNPAGTRKTVESGLPGAGDEYRIDGSIINDMRRGAEYQWPPVYTSYPWVGLEGFVPAALILQRAGYPAFEVADRAVLRSVEYLWYLRQETGEISWFDGKRADETVHLVNVMYGTDYPTAHLSGDAIGGGRTFGFTDWTHP